MENFIFTVTFKMTMQQKTIIANLNSNKKNKKGKSLGNDDDADSIYNGMRQNIFEFFFIMCVSVNCEKL